MSFEKKIDSESVLYHELFKKISGRHLIPSLQRPYVWEDKKQVKKFLDDIKENDIGYFIGSIVFVISDEGTVGREEVIDGQQRMVTISLILIAIRDLVNNYNLSKKFKTILQEINSYLYDNKEIIRLKFIDEYSEQLNGLLLSRSMIKTDTKKRLKRNYDYIYNYLNKYFSEGKSGNVFLKDFFEKIKLLEIVSIKCKDNEIAYELFESINATSLSLASVDLIKNFVFKHSKDSDGLQEIEEKWKKIDDLFSEDRSLLKAFIRHQWISEGEYISHSRLYGAVDNKFRRGDLNIAEYVDTLLLDAKCYQALRNAGVESLDKIKKGVRFDTDTIKSVLQFLSYLNIDQVYAPILFFYKTSDNDNFKKYLNRLTAFQFLFKYIPGSPSSAEKIFANFSKEGHKKYNENFQKLYKLVDKQQEIFKDNILEKLLYKDGKSGDLQFILERLVFSKKGPKAFKCPTIEHIINKNGRKERNINKIGNLTIFERDDNSKFPVDIEKKFKFYLKSNYRDHVEIVKKYDFINKPDKSIDDRGRAVTKTVYDIFLEILRTGKIK